MKYIHEKLLYEAEWSKINNYNGQYVVGVLTPVVVQLGKVKSGNERGGSGQP